MAKTKVTAEQIAEWKKKHDDVFQIDVDDKTCFLRKPNRNELGYAAVAGKTNPLKYNEYILKSCWLGGDEEIRTNDDLFLSVGEALAEMIETKQAEIKKL